VGARLAHFRKCVTEECLHLQLRKNTLRESQVSQIGNGSENTEEFCLIIAVEYSQNNHTLEEK